MIKTEERLILVSASLPPMRAFFTSGAETFTVSNFIIGYLEWGVIVVGNDFIIYLEFQLKKVIICKNQRKYYL